ncbi:MAG: hypothetical protein ACREVN_02615 [Gammaproteobacteria bacterium]
MKRYALIAVLILAVSANAQEDPDSCRQALFEHLDVNSDGVLSPTEAAAAPLELGSDFFAHDDENRDGVLDRREYEKVVTFISCEMCPAEPGCET